MKNALSIDLEDWYHPELVKNHLSGEPESQVEQAVEPILRLLDQYGVRATFFVLGDVVRKNPDLLRTLYQKGHEIASHGMTHSPLWDLDYNTFDRELKDFNALIGEILGNNVKISGFRAPTFSLDNRTRFALQCLIDNGYEYDSSIFPVRNYMYGVTGAPCSIYRPDPDDLSSSSDVSEILEFPLTVCEFGKIKIPVSGGFYLRVLPYFMLKAMLKRVNRIRPFVIYLHPWETFAGTPRVKEMGYKNTFITYYGMKSCLKKVERLLRDFEFTSLKEVIGENSR